MVQSKYFTKIIVVILSMSALYAAFESPPRSTINISTGKLTLCSTGGFIDIFNEPGSITYFNKAGIETMWNRPFQLKELQLTTIAGAFLYKGWGFGAGILSFGNKIYTENVFTLIISKAFKQKLHFGIGTNIYQLKIDNYGSDNAFGINASIRYQINESWNWVSTSKNINSASIGSTDEKLPQIVTSGFIGKVYDKLTIAAEWEQDIEYKGALKFGIQARIFEQMLISAGYISNPGQFTAGLSITINNIYFEYGTVAHNDLGLFSHQLGIGYNFNRN